MEKSANKRIKLNQDSAAATFNLLWERLDLGSDFTGHSLSFREIVRVWAILDSFSEQELITFVTDPKIRHLGHRSTMVLMALSLLGESNPDKALQIINESELSSKFSK